MNAFERVARHQRGTVHVVLGPFVYALRRVTSADLHAAGLTEIVGAGAGAEALRVVEQELADQRVADPVKREAYRAHNEQVDQRARERALDEQLSTPEGVAAWFARLEAYVVASVVGNGDLRDGVEVADSPRVGRYQVLAVDARLADYTARIDPFRFVPAGADEEPEGNPPAMRVDRLSLLQRQALGLAAMAVAEVVSELLPFRPRSGDARDARQAG